MRIGRIKLLWVKRDVLGRPLHPWEEITLDQLTPEAQKLIQKMARVCARDFFEEMREAYWESLSANLKLQIQEAFAAAQERPQEAAAGQLVGDCMLCGLPHAGSVPIIRAGDSWAHKLPGDCHRPTVPGQTTTNGEQQS